MQSESSDAELITASLDTPSRFGELFDRHYAEINRYLARRVARGIADEVAAEAFVVAFRIRQRYDPQRTDARPWLYGIAANLARRHWRTERRRLRAYARAGVDPVCDDGGEIDRRSTRPPPRPSWQQRVAVDGRPTACGGWPTSAYALIALPQAGPHAIRPQ